MSRQQSRTATPEPVRNPTQRTERPILFKGRLVQAILEGRKSQTRRIMRLQPTPDWSPSSWGEVHRKDANGELGEPRHPRDFMGYGVSNYDGDEAYACPYGAPGDVLWVREAFGYVDPALNPPTGKEIVYRADAPAGHDATDAWVTRWRPSIHMPRTACRLRLEVLDVRVQRLQDITDEDAIAEGLQYDVDMAAWVGRATQGHADEPELWEDPRQAFRSLWDSINTKPREIKRGGRVAGYVSYPWGDVQEERTHRGLPWRVQGNPWVWAVTFQLIQEAS